MAGPDSHRPSEWRRLLPIATDLIDQLREKVGGYDVDWSFGGGTAMMIQIGHRESHDIDIFLNDPQLLGFIDPSRSQLHFETLPSDYVGDGLRFQKFAFQNVGEIDFIVAGPLTAIPYDVREIEGRQVRLETIPEIIAKKVYYRGAAAKPRDIFDIAAAARSHRKKIIEALQAFPDRVTATRMHLDVLNPEFVERTIAQLMILPGYEAFVADSLNLSRGLLEEVGRS